MLTPGEVHVLKMALLAAKNTYRASEHKKTDWVRYVATTTKIRKEFK